METGLEMLCAGHHISIFQHHVIFQPAPYRSRLDVVWSFSLLLRSWTSVWSFCWTLVQLLGSIGIYCYGMIGMFLSPCVPWRPQDSIRHHGHGQVDMIFRGPVTSLRGSCWSGWGIQWLLATWQVQGQNLLRIYLREQTWISFWWPQSVFQKGHRRSLLHLLGWRDWICETKQL